MQVAPEIEGFNFQSLLDHAKIVKDDRSADIFLATDECSQLDVIIKNYKFKGYGHCILRSLHISRAENYWNSAKLLEEINVRTPKPLALILKKSGPLCIESYVITEFIQGQTGQNFIDYPERFSEKETSNFVDGIISALKKMYSHHIIHGDTKTANFIQSQEGTYVIDLDSSNRSKKGKDHFLKDLDRLERDWVNHPYKDIAIPKINLLQNEINNII
ncbi:lipopolysaccharide kinase InaA family protein [Endozoicomonas sp. OPT23]|uniref:lipopolysaccharide kinase InaA family protein n=1 Tax=Endozoicomonas sp. OPT23 TaxID=2072845 RepID=UPI001891758F|nr:lipopolysaccharide kinase InaA family protein [Endozoicomonas sp. OPT23]